MVELPEAVTIARQITRDLAGKQIAECERGNTPHKFAFYTYSPEEYASRMQGKVIGPAQELGGMILVQANPGYVIALGGGGERILYHPNASTLPTKYHLLLRFADDSYLTVSIQGWGSALLIEADQVAVHPFCVRRGVSPISPEFTSEYFFNLWRDVPPQDKRAIKYFIISQPQVQGVGNGYLQDILFLAKLHPRRRAASLTSVEKEALYDAIRTVLFQAVEQGGRDTERDIYDHPGRYQRILDSRTAGQPCPECGTKIEKISFLGGASYFCPQCQASSG